MTLLALEEIYCYQEDLKLKHLPMMVFFFAYKQNHGFCEFKHFCATCSIIHSDFHSIIQIDFYVSPIQGQQATTPLLV